MGKGAVTLNSLSRAVMKNHGVGLGSIIANMKKKKTKYEFDGKIIDRAVTYDAHRILRIPKSIHPKAASLHNYYLRTIRKSDEHF